MAIFTLKVVEKRKETGDTVTLGFKQPALKKIKYTAGQYLTLIFRINGRRYIRPYSFSSAPSVDQHLEITIKRVPGGVVSNYILDHVAIGDSIQVMEPMGDFILGEDFAYNRIFLWGAGSGITPLISIAKHILTTKSGKVILIYGNKDQMSTIFREKLEELQNDHPARFSVLYFYSEKSILFVNHNTVPGRIDAKKALKILEEEDMSDSYHFICGPDGLKESVKCALNEFGVLAEQIKTEDFKLSRNPSDFKGIEDQWVKIAYQEQERSVQVARGKSILEAALDMMVELPYSCQTGNCITCKGKLIYGDIKTIGVTRRPDGLEKDEFLLCCSYPVTKNVHIIIDNS